MKSLEKLLLVASLALAAYAAFTLVAGLFFGTLCYQSNCVQRGESGEGFLAYASVYGLVVAFGVVSAWRSYKNLRTVHSNTIAPGGRA